MKNLKLDTRGKTALAFNGLAVAAALFTLVFALATCSQNPNSKPTKPHPPTAPTSAPAEPTLELSPFERGAQPAEFKMENGVKVFELTLDQVMWSLRKADAPVEAWAFNGQVPGPLLVMKKGDRVRVLVRNKLNEETSVHWHGIDVPNKMDGVAHVTQEAIKPGETFVYEFTVKNEPGTYMYHTHVNAIKQVTKGVYGPIVVQSEKKYDHEQVMMLSGPMSGHYLINGKSFPDTDVINVKPGQTILFHIVNIGPADSHPMHIHGHEMKIIAQDGRRLSAPYRAVTITVAPGQSFDAEVIANADPGTWLFHCHVLPHVTGPDPLSHDPAKAHAGMIMLIQYK